MQDRANSVTAAAAIRENGRTGERENGRTGGRIIVEEKKEYFIVKLMNGIGYTALVLGATILAISVVTALLDLFFCVRCN